MIIFQLDEIARIAFGHTDAANHIDEFSILKHIRSALTSLARRLQEGTKMLLVSST